jgi:hypothetical protein
MEVRGTYEAGAKSSKVWFAIAALFAIVALGVAGAFLVKAVATASAPSSVKSITTGVMAPDAAERNAKITQAQAGPQLLDRNAQRDPNAVSSGDGGYKPIGRTGAQDR